MTGLGRAAARASATPAGVKQRNQGMGAAPVPPTWPELLPIPRGGEGFTAAVIQRRDASEL